MITANLAQLRAERNCILARAVVLRRQIRGAIGELDCLERRLADIEAAIRALAVSFGQQQITIGGERREDHV